MQRSPSSQLSINQLTNSLLECILKEQHGSIKFDIIKKFQENINNSEIHQIIFQLCYIFYVTGNNYLEEFLKKYGLMNSSNYYRLEWTLKALSEDSKCFPIPEYFAKFLTLMKHEYVNKGLTNTNSREDYFQDMYLIKEARANYQDRQDQLIFNLIEQSLRLKSIEIEERKEQMIAFLKKINQNINYLWQITSQGGITIPFNHGQIDSYLVVHILDDEFTCFNTAKRVPYKIIVETIDPSELELMKKAVEIYQSSSDIQELNPFYDIEKEMKSIAQLKILQQYDIDELKKLALKKVEFHLNPENQKVRRKPRDKDIYASSTNCSSIWGEDWNKTQSRIRKSSQFGHLKTYQIRQIIVKGGDDLRNELLIMQMIKKIKEIFEKHKLDIFLRPYDIILTSPNSGILEFIPNTVSIDKIKRDYQGYTLKQLYENFFDSFSEAQTNFLQSLAGYSLICYLFQLKDRHNGNILIDNQGHIIHIDFGFVLTLTPGNLGFETAPFKLIEEYEELLDGKGSYFHNYFQTLIFKGLMALQQEIDEIMNFIKIMNFSPKHNLLVSLEKFKIEDFRKRFMEKCSPDQLYENVQNIVKESSNSWTTTLYDYFQFKTNSIYY
ncbi:unnamed protein product [Paramecium octaurelia]|uniref:1-phosphatidylinositol 4-kinase n=1 Tax=Paramecium octaurelia TaxID=43137 RepID=A0A8S1Y5T5_PAROT|nr:unnamed protein product [Paramecium octaurelia]